MDRGMTMRAGILIGLSAAALAGCAEMRPRGIVQSPGQDWRAVASPGDRVRMSEWRSAFVTGLKQAHAAGKGAAIDAQGALLMPDAAVMGPAIPSGEYRCRIVKLGMKSPGMLPYVAYPPFACRVQPMQGLQQFAKLTGSQRPVGLLFPGDQLRSVFLGTLVLGDETRAMQYGHDPERDLAGFVERIGPQRWRLLLPAPAFESLIDVIEIVPAG